MAKRVYGTVKLSVTNVSARVALPVFNIQDAADPAAPLYNRGMYLEVFIANVAANATVVATRMGNAAVAATLPASAGPSVPSDVLPAANTWIHYYAYNLQDGFIAAITDVGTADMYVSLVDGKDLG